MKGARALVLDLESDGIAVRVEVEFSRHDVEAHVARNLLHAGGGRITGSYGCRRTRRRNLTRLELRHHPKACVPQLHDARCSVDPCGMKHSRRVRQQTLRIA